jgi:hypothetical protein
MQRTIGKDEQSAPWPVNMVYIKIVKLKQNILVDCDGSSINGQKYPS